ncbi:MAG: DNA translocase FtsK [Bacteroidota bacterium]
MAKKKSDKEPPSSPHRSLQIFAVLVMLFSVFLLISIITFSVDDIPFIEGKSLGNLLHTAFSDINRPPIANALGLFGAYFSYLLLANTLGYPVVLFIVLLIAWGSTLLFTWSTPRLLIITNYTILFSVLLSSCFGVTQRMFEFPKGSIEWSGIVGAFIADGSIKFLGEIGAFLSVTTALFITFVLAAKIDLFILAQKIKSLLVACINWIREKTARDESEEESEEVETEEEEKPATEIELRIDDSEEQLQKKKETARSPKLKDNAVASDADELNPETAEDNFPPPIIEINRAEEPLPHSPKKIKEKEKKKETTIPIEIAVGTKPDEELDYVLPSVDLLEPLKKAEEIDKSELEANAELVKSKLAHFGVGIEKVTVTPGPVVTLYELVPASDVKISRIVSLQDDLQLALSARGIRIIAPIPGRNTVGVEIPNRNPAIVQLRSIIHSSKFQESKGMLPLAMGKTISGEIFIDDLSKMPHLLLAGATGSGKSVGVNNIVMSLLYRLYPHEVKFVIIDPKKIEMSHYALLRHHYLAVSPDINEDIVTNPNNAALVLKSLTVEMDNRYDLLARAGVRNIYDYTEKFKAGKLIPKDGAEPFRRLPYIVTVIDELADLMLMAGKEVEPSIARLAQMSRAVGIHLVVATQRPSVDVITGVIKANFPARIAYLVSSKIDSRTILDTNGAEQLIGRGDMLFLPGSSPKPERMQNAFVSTEEVERVTEYIARQPGYAEPYKLPTALEKKGGMSGEDNDGLTDELLAEAAHLVVMHQQGAVSFLQRKLSVGYARAGKLIDSLEYIGVVGPFTGSKARDVLVNSEQELSRILESYNIR